jgi:hypothetical protein
MTNALARTPGTLLDGTSALAAQLPGVTSEAWTAFIHALTIGDNGKPRGFGIVTVSGGFGCFDLRPRRLADLGIMHRLRVERVGAPPAEGEPDRRRQVFVGDFVAPWTRAKFLASPLAQYNALVDSLQRYDATLSEITLPDGITRSGALAIFHRMGPSGIVKWQERKLEATVAFVKRTNGKF